MAAVGEDLGKALDAVLLHGAYIGSTQGFPEPFPLAWTAGILAGMDPTSLEFWEWFYATGNEGKSLSAEEMQRAIEERWHPDLVLIQDPKFPGTAGEFHGYEGLTAVNRELIESWDEIQWLPREVHDLGGDRFLVLIEASGLGRGSGLPMNEAEIGHIVKLREGRAERLETYVGWDAAREVAGLT